jgi:hypothetical protein
MKIEAIERMIDALTDRQRERLLNILQARLDMWNGTATKLDLARAIVGIPKEDIKPLLDIALAIKTADR